MKLTKTLMAAAALATLAMPMTATAQVGPDSVIGTIQNVVGNVYIKRGDQYLRVVNASAVMPYDKIVAEAGGSALVSLNGCGGEFAPCSNQVNEGNMVFLDSNDYCGDLAALMPIGPNDSVLSAASRMPAGSAPSIGTAMSQRTLLALLGTAAVGTGLYLILDDDEPSSP